MKIKSLRKNQIFESGSRLRVGKVLASYNARPKEIPLIKHSKLIVVFKTVIFPKNYLFFISELDKD